MCYGPCRLAVVRVVLCGASDRASGQYVPSEQGDDQTSRDAREPRAGPREAFTGRDRTKSVFERHFRRARARAMRAIPGLIRARTRSAQSRRCRDSNPSLFFGLFLPVKTGTDQVRTIGNDFSRRFRQARARCVKPPGPNIHFLAAARINQPLISWGLAIFQPP